MLVAWIGTIGAARKTRLCLTSVCTPDGAPLLVLPLGIENRRGVRVLGFADGGVSDYNAPAVLTDRDLTDAMPAIWARIADALPGFDIASIDKVPATAGDRPNPLVALARTREFRPGQVVELSGTWESFARIGLPRAQDSRRKRRRLAERGPVAFRVAETPQDKGVVLAALIEQKRRRYLETRGFDGLARPGYLDYLNRTVSTPDLTDSIHLSALWCGETIVAAHWGIATPNRYYYLMPSFAGGDWSRYSPGRLIVEDLIAWCYDKGIRLFDFGHGDEPYKAEFETREVALYRMDWPRTALGHAYAAGLSARQKLLASPLGPGLRRMKARLSDIARGGRA